MTKKSHYLLILTMHLLLVLLGLYLTIIYSQPDLEGMGIDIILPFMQTLVLIVTLFLYFDRYQYIYHSNPKRLKQLKSIVNFVHSNKDLYCQWKLKSLVLTLSGNVFILSFIFLFTFHRKAQTNIWDYFSILLLFGSGIWYLVGKYYLEKWFEKEYQSKILWKNRT